MQVLGTHQLGSADFSTIVEIVKREARIHIAPSKHTLVHSRLSRRVRARGLAGFSDYVALVQQDDEERAAMVSALTTNHTHFFRENHHFEHFRETVIPELRTRRGGSPIRIWSAGCSSGQEVYSIALTLLGETESEARWLRGVDVRLLATDIASDVVERARLGRYAEAEVEAIPASYRRHWMSKEGDAWQMGPEARSLVTARELNLFGEWPMRQRYDAIFCRNVMIYFEEGPKEELELRFAQMLRPGGYLYIGHSERLLGCAESLFETCGKTIYRRLGEGGHA